MLLLTSGCKPNFDIGSKELLCSVYLYIYSRFGLRVFSATFVNSGLFCVDLYFRLTLMIFNVCYGTMDMLPLCFLNFFNLSEETIS